MKRTMLILFIGVTISICAHVSETMAVGIGFYATSGMGDGEYEFDSDTNPDIDLDTDIQRCGYGFMLDTAVANDRVFNYRLNIGIYNWSEEFEDDSEFELSGFMISHDFGFGVLRNKYVRLWLGPEVRFALGDGDEDDNHGYDVEIKSFGVGPVLGLNVHLGPVVSLGFKSGYLFEGVNGDADSLDESIDFSGDDTMYYFTLSLIFRINDEY